LGVYPRGLFTAYRPRGSPSRDCFHAIVHTIWFYKQRAFVSAVGKKMNTRPEGTMSSGTTDKIKGATNEAVGKAKRAVGKATGSAKLKREGDIQEAKGDAQTAIGKVKQALKKRGLP
jgi:uncharacterized protein YjbJ (UPF0337 family)